LGREILDMPRSSAPAITILAALGLPVLLQAQSAIRGTIRADSSNRAVVGAEVVLDPGARSVRTNSSGDFLLGSLQAGRYTLTFRSIGFRPFKAEAVLSGQDTLELDVALVPVAQQLAPLSVTAVTPRLSGKMEEFERRRKMGFGRFFTRAELANWENGPLSNVLRTAASVKLVLLPYSCNGGFAAASNRVSTVSIPESMQCGRQPINSVCYLDIYIDGARFWYWGDRPPPDIDQYVVRDIQAMEVYRGFAQLPAEFATGNGKGCGAISIWTRTGEP
jgi:hypothetical protein